MFRPVELFASSNSITTSAVTDETNSVETEHGTMKVTYSSKKRSIAVHTNCRRPGTSRSHFRRTNAPLDIRVIINSVSHDAAELGMRRIANAEPNDVWLKGFIEPFDPRLDEAWESFLLDIRNDSTNGCDIKQECTEGTIPLAISYKWQADPAGERMSDVQFNNLRNMVCHHMSSRGTKVSFWLDQHMRKYVGEREKDQWLSYGTTAYRNVIVCYLPNVDITGGHPDPQIKIGDEPVDASEEFARDTSRIWIAFEIRRATQGVGLMCGKGTELGVCKNVILDGPKTMIDMWTSGFIVGGRLSNKAARCQEEGDILYGRLLGIVESWDEFLLSERDKLLASGSTYVPKILRYKHDVGRGNGDRYRFSPGGEFESDIGLTDTSICDIGPGEHCTSSYVTVRMPKSEECWDYGATLLAGDFSVIEKAGEVSRVPIRRIAVSCDKNNGTIRELWISLVSTRHAEKYCCVVIEDFPQIGRVVCMIDIWPINSHIFDAAVDGSFMGAAGVVAYLGELEVTTEDWSSYEPLAQDKAILAARLPELIRRAMQRLLDESKEVPAVCRKE